MQNSRELELLNQIKDLQNELKILKKQKKYGLVWEEKEEKIDTNKLPIFSENTDLRIHESEEKPINLIIEGDNFHTLSALQYTHFGKIDVIYIDPPYNTGKKDFIYNDDYVDKEDTFRHSKWLSFMEKRLKLARNLLKNDGVIFISIDDNEFAQLKLLCDEVFGEGNFVSNLIWKSKSGGANDSKFFAIDHEYIFCYSKNIYDFKLNLDIDANVTTSYNNFDEFGSYALERLDKQSIRYSESLDFEIIDLSGRSYFPKHKNPDNPNATWRWSKDKVKKEFDKLVFKNGNVYTKNYKKDGTIPRSLLIEERFGRTRTGKTKIYDIFNLDIFSNPKPSTLINFLLKIASKPNSIILDFFAGSGTTGHAVMELNKEDGGNRQFILCSNTEATKENPEKNICKNITYERNKRVITGYTNAKGEKIEGLGGNLRYYKTEFIDKNIEKSLDDLRYDFINKCDDLLCIKEDIFTKIDKKDFDETLKIFKRKNKFLIICYDVLKNREKLQKMLTIFDKTEEVSVYIFTLNPSILVDFGDVGKNISFKNIPDEILETYKKIFFK